jgi:hypothetical protein
MDMVERPKIRPQPPEAITRASAGKARISMLTMSWARQPQHAPPSSKSAVSAATLYTHRLTPIASPLPQRTQQSLEPRHKHGIIRVVLFRLVEQLPVHLVLINSFIKFRPEVKIDFSLPSLRYRAKEILTISVDHHFRAGRGVGYAFQSSGNLHPVTGRSLSHARKSLLLAIFNNNSSPATLT